MKMEDAYENGRKCGEAINQQDQARYNFLRDWFRRAIASEPNKPELQTMFDGGYKDARENHIQFKNLSARY